MSPIRPVKLKTDFLLETYEEKIKRIKRSEAFKQTAKALMDRWEFIRKEVDAIHKYEQLAYGSSGSSGSSENPDIPSTYLNEAAVKPFLYVHRDPINNKLLIQRCYATVTSQNEHQINYEVPGTELKFVVFKGNSCEAYGYAEEAMDGFPLPVVSFIPAFYDAVKVNEFKLKKVLNISS